MKIEKMKFIDLFAGIGGFRYALQDLGCSCVFSSEWDKFCQESYKLNFNEVPFGDITKIDEKDIPSFDIFVLDFLVNHLAYQVNKKGLMIQEALYFLILLELLNIINLKLYCWKMLKI